MNHCNQKKRNPLPAITVICVLSLAVMVLVLCHPKSESGSFTPPPFESTAEYGTPDVPDGLGWQKLDANAFQVGICGKVIPDGNTVDVWLTNPEENTVWLKLRVLDEKGNSIGETGLIRPGEYVRSVMLSRVPEFGAKITLKLMAYQPETYYSEGAISFNTTISK